MMKKRRNESIMKCKRWWWNRVFLNSGMKGACSRSRRRMSLIKASVTIIAYLVHTELPVTPSAFCVSVVCKFWGASLFTGYIIKSMYTRLLNTHVAFCPIHLLILGRSEVFKGICEIRLKINHLGVFNVIEFFILDWNIAKDWGSRL